MLTETALIPALTANTGQLYYSFNKVSPKWDFGGHGGT